MQSSQKSAKAQSGREVIARAIVSENRDQQAAFSNKLPASVGGSASESAAESTRLGNHMGFCFDPNLVA